jgi:hypothetical protein
VRSLVNVQRVDRLVDVTRRAFDARDAHLAGACLAETTPYYAPDPEYAKRSDSAQIGRALTSQLSAVLTADSPRAFFAVADALEAARVPAVVAEYFGERPLLTVEKTTMRRVDPPDRPPAWHQDGSFLDSAVRAVNVWIALSPCGAGTDSPGLQILPKRLDRLVDTGRGGGKRLKIEVRPELLASAGQDIVPISPTFNAGDALLFDELFLHATAIAPGLTRPRYAVECWMFPPSSCDPNYVSIFL